MTSPSSSATLMATWWSVYSTNAPSTANSQIYFVPVKVKVPPQLAAAKAHAKRCHEIMLRHGFMEGQGDLRGHANRRGIRMRTVLIHVAWQIDGQEAALRNPVLRLHPPGAGFMNTHDFAKRLLSTCRGRPRTRPPQGARLPHHRECK